MYTISPKNLPLSGAQMKWTNMRMETLLPVGAMPAHGATWRAFRTTALKTPCGPMTTASGFQF
jgi:hypothetical protein